MFLSSRRARILTGALISGAVILAAVMLGLRSPAAALLVERGIEARKDWRMSSAERCFELALTLDPESVEARLESVFLFQSQGRLIEARRLLIPLREHISSLAPRQRCRVHFAEAHNQRYSGNAQAAAEGLEAAATLAALTGLEDLALRIRLAQTELLYEVEDDFETAEQNLNNILDDARRLGYQALEARTLTALGIFHGFYRRQRRQIVDDFYNPALTLYDELEHRSGLAGVKTLLAVESMSRNDYAQASRFLDASRRDYDAIGSISGAAQVATHLGTLHARLENHRQAFAHFRRGLNLSEQSGDRLWPPRVLGLIAHLHLRRAEYEQTLLVLDRLLAEPFLPITSRRDHLVTRGHAYLHLGRPDEALDAYLQALELDRQRPGKAGGVRANIHIMLAHTAMQTGRFDDADVALAVVEAMAIDDKGWGPTVLQFLARADFFDLTGQRQEALAQLVAAAEIESRTFGAARSHFFQTHYWQVFNRLFSLLFEGALPMDDAQALVFRLLEQMRFRSFRSLIVNLHGSDQETHSSPERERALQRIESLSASANQGGSDHREALRQAYLDYETYTLSAELSASAFDRVSASQPIQLDELQELLSADTALLEYVLAGDRPFALIVRKDRIDSVALETTAKELKTRVKLFRYLLFDPQDPDRWRPVAKDLHRLLIQPMEDNRSLEQIENLVLIPMDPLHDLPFAALLGDDGTFLVERFSLGRALSATDWAKPGIAGGRKAERTRAALTFGLRQAQGSTLPALEYAEREAQHVASILGGEARIGSRATEGALRDAIRSSRTLHIAGHGLLDSHLPLHSHLQLEPGDGHDGRLTIREILDLDLNMDLVTLSACETALSRDARSSQSLEVDRLGFVEAFLHAGAGHVLASLLPVSDRAGAELMADFYRQLEQFSSPSIALSQAQRGRLRAQSSDASHPRYWAPFILVGRQSP